MGLYSKDTATKMDLVAVDGANNDTQCKNTVYQRKQIGKSISSIALRSRQFGSPSSEPSPLKDGTSSTERQFCIDG